MKSTKDPNEFLICNLIKSTIQRVFIESTAGIIGLIIFARLLVGAEPGSTSFYGCLIIMVSVGFILGVVWSNALSFRLLESHPPSEIEYWREAFLAQGRLLRRAPYWYCGPLLLGATVFAFPTNSADIVPFLLVALIFLTVCAIVVWINRKVAYDLEQAGAQLATS